MLNYNSIIFDNNYDTKPMPLRLLPNKEYSLPVYCCFGCKSVAKSSGAIERHFKEGYKKECGKKHKEFLEDLRERYSETGKKNPPKGLDAKTVKACQELVYELYDKIRRMEKMYHVKKPFDYDSITEEFRAQIPFALDQATLTANEDVEESPSVEPPVEPPAEPVVEPPAEMPSIIYVPKIQSLTPSQKAQKMGLSQEDLLLIPQKDRLSMGLEEPPLPQGRFIAESPVFPTLITNTKRIIRRV
jgi:hypothetical protein